MSRSQPPTNRPGRPSSGSACHGRRAEWSVFVEVGSDLIRRARAGDRQALVGVVEAYQGPVYTVALAVMRNPVDAADMTQETFVRLLRALGTYRGDGPSFASWVHRMTVNVCVDTLRRRKRS